LTIDTSIRKLWPMARATGIATLLSVLLALAACGDDPGKVAGSDKSYAEGSVRMEIEFLDTGLLKGHSYANAKDGWTAASMKVEAVDHEGARWQVLEPEFSGLGSQSATEFFEVTIQELPRGEQITVTTTVGFEDRSGQRVDRTAMDQWPP
jgi:hypothetical protein